LAACFGSAEWETERETERETGTQREGEETIVGREGSIVLFVDLHVLYITV